MVPLKDPIIRYNKRKTQYNKKKTHIYIYIVSLGMKGCVSH